MYNQGGEESVLWCIDRLRFTLAHPNLSAESLLPAATYAGLSDKQMWFLKFVGEGNKGRSSLQTGWSEQLNSLFCPHALADR